MSQRWNITDEQRQQCIDSLMRIVEADDVPCAIRACRALMQMEAQNQLDDNGEPPEGTNRFAEILRKLQSEN